jgi:hypothetical protein
MELQTFSLHTPADAARIDAAPGRPSLVLAFGTPDRAAADPLIAALRQRLPDALFVGCSTAGEIVGDAIVDGSVSGAVVSFDRTRPALATRAISAVSDSFAVGRALAAELSGADLRGVFILSDGLAVNGSELTRGLAAVLPPGVAVTGGLAGDGDRFRATWVLRDGRPQAGVVTAVGFYGDALAIAHGSRGGWDTFGPTRKVTRADANVLYELDGRPVLALYKQYLGELAQQLPSSALHFPLAILPDSPGGEPIVRTVLAVDETTQSLTFAGDLPVGARVQLMRANFDRLIGSAAVAGDHSAPAPDATNVLCVAISCVGRRLVLGPRTERSSPAHSARSRPARARSASTRTARSRRTPRGTAPSTTRP